MSKRKQTVLDRINVDFAHRQCPIGADPETHADREMVRELVGCLACDLVRLCPDSRELNHALNRLDEAVMWAHAAIDRHREKSIGRAEDGI